jgi:hypothetical protein
MECASSGASKEKGSIMDSQTINLVAICLTFGAGIAIPVSIAWFEHRTRRKGLETLRVYAERGEEPPASVIQAVTEVTNVYGRPPQMPRKPWTRGNHLAHAAASTVLATGLAGLVWWRVSAYDEKGLGIVVGVLVAVFFAGSAAAQLVYAYYATDKMVDDERR